jgi:hypothetical protein
MVRFSVPPTNARLRYIWKDDSTNSDLGRRGTLIMQEASHLFGGDEIAIALIDCTAATKDIKLEITDLVSVTNINNNSFPEYASQTRAEIWRFEG